MVDILFGHVLAYFLGSGAIYNALEGILTDTTSLFPWESPALIDLKSQFQCLNRTGAGIFERHAGKGGKFSSKRFFSAAFFYASVICIIIKPHWCQKNSRLRFDFSTEISIWVSLFDLIIFCNTGEQTKSNYRQHMEAEDRLMEVFVLIFSLISANYFIFRLYHFVPFP